MILTNVVVTAYCLLGTMASGVQVYDGAIACPRDVPIGTKVCIEHKLYTCEDRTHTKFDGRYDIWMSSCEQAINFGKKTLIINVYETNNKGV